MPKRMFKRKRQVRRRGGYRKRGQKTTLYNSSLRPIPARFVTKLKYCEALTVSAPGMSIYKWNLNSVWDPSRTGIGHQPYGYDQLAALYNRYRVISCSYVISAISDSANISLCVVPANDTAPLVSNLSEAREQPRAKFLVQNPGGNLKTLKGKVYLPALTGRTKSQYMASDAYQATTAASPTELMVLNVFGQGMNDDPLFNPNITYSITLHYEVEFFDINNYEQS